MPGINKPGAMADFLNCGLGLGNNDDLRPLMPAGPLLARMLVREMHKDLLDFNNVPPQMDEDNLILASVNPRASNDRISPVLHVSDSMGDSFDEKCTDNELDNCENDDAKSEESASACEQVPSNESLYYFLPINYSKRNPWRRIIGLHTSGQELQSATYPARTSVKKLRFAQAKKPLNYLYSYFSVHLLDCGDESSITVGVCRKDYPSKVAPGKTAGSIGYFSDTGSVFYRDAVHLDGPVFSKGDVIGCGIIYPPHYKRYVDLSTDDNSDGMTDVVLTSLLNVNKKSMDFVCNMLNLNVEEKESSDYESSNSFEIETGKENASDCDYYNENFVESRTQVEVYFTYNMQVVGKVLSHIPVGGFYPTVHIFSSSAIKMSVDLNPPSS
ncbi:SPRY domain-containing protein 3, partial [Stegodyphus mimosarum]